MTSTPMRLANELPPAPPSFNLSLEDLGKIVQRAAGAVNAAQIRATSAWKSARSRPNLAQGADAIWNEVRYRSTDRSLSPAELLRIALEAEAALNDLAALCNGLNCPLLPQFGHPCMVPGIANTPEARTALNSFAGTAHWLRQHDAKMATADEVQRQEQERAQKNAPAKFLNFLRARGINLQLKGEELIAPPGTDMTKILPSELAAIKDWKPELAAILKAEAATRTAARADEPLVLA